MDMQEDDYNENNDSRMKNEPRQTSASTSVVVMPSAAAVDVSSEIFQLEGVMEQNGQREEPRTMN